MSSIKTQLATIWNIGVVGKISALLFILMSGCICCAITSQLTRTVTTPVNTFLARTPSPSQPSPKNTSSPKHTTTPEPAPTVVTHETAVRLTAYVILTQEAVPPTRTPSPPTRTPGPITKETPVVSGNWVYAVVLVEKQNAIAWSEFGNKTKAKGVWLVVFVMIMNIGNENYSLNAWDFELRDSGAVKYNVTTDITMFAFNRYNELSNLGDQFPPDVPVTTALLFDVSPDASGFRLYLKQAKEYIDLGL